MAVIAQIRIPSDSFVVGRIFNDLSDMVLEFKPVIPLQQNSGTRKPLVWISGSDPETVEAALLDTDYIVDVDRFATEDERALFEIEWADDIDGVIGPIADTGARILKAIGTAEEWEFHLLFDSHESLSAFNVAATGNEIPVTLEKVHNSRIENVEPDDPSFDDAFRESHRETLLVAYRNGYYESPRQVNLSELAKHEDVSDSALSKRLRRATASLIERTLLNEEEAIDVR